MNIEFDLPFGFSNEIPEGVSYQAIIFIQGDPIRNVYHGGSPMSYQTNFENTGYSQFQPEQVITHPVVVTQNGEEVLTRIKGQFDEEGKDTLGLTVPMTKTYHINSASDALNTLYPEKSVDVHEIYHRLVEKMIPEIKRYDEELEELTVRKVTDKLEKTNSADHYKPHIKDKFKFYEGNYAEEIDKTSEEIANEILRQPVKIYLPTNQREEDMLRNGQLPPYVNTAA
jgi:hypothetical protein